MSRLKDDMLEQQEAFWNKANELSTECDSFAEFFRRAWIMAPNFMKNGESSKIELEDQLTEGWNEIWSKYNV
jgi:hypothetical protein|tara:strand:+ start:139 stop:354 length:216 start_codon:yes stop_codon:yes gene_type:complete